jgi:antitoxin component HigA of HigAB toxin-antitoxin module
MGETAIKTEDEYESALKRADAIFDAEPGTPEGDELDRLCNEIVAYEDANYPL